MCLAVPGQVKTLYRERQVLMGKVDFGGIAKAVCMECLPEIEPGDYVLVHVGFAISKIDELAAQQTLQTFAELGHLEEELGQSGASGDDPKLGREDRRDEIPD